MSEVPPALQAARNSWACAMARDKQGWLDLMTDDILIEDPIGVGPTNPTGEGLRGKAAVGEFFEQNIAPNKLTITPEESFTAGNESAHVLTLCNEFPDGTKVIVHGVFTYRIDDHAKLTNLRGYWRLEDAKIEQPGG
jgi:steroid delta-isomerase